jgi:hypothetical protein
MMLPLSAAMLLIGQPPTWASDRTLTVPIALYEPYNLLRVPSSNLWSGIAIASGPQVKLEDKVTIEGSDLPVTRADFAPATAGTLMSYQHLAENWDSEGAAAPSLEAISGALCMLAATPPSLEPPKPMILASGEVALYWDYGDTYAEIGFDENGRYYAYAERPGFDSVHLNDVNVEDSADLTVFPMDVLEILTAEPLRAAA